MFEQKRAYWRSLDNAAKLFSAASSPKDTRVFRFYCELKEEVEENVLQEALDQTIEKYPVLQDNIFFLFQFYIQNFLYPMKYNKTPAPA